jgi:hypothetical protein
LTSLELVYKHTHTHTHTRAHTHTQKHTHTHTHTHTFLRLFPLPLQPKGLDQCVCIAVALILACYTFSQESFEKTVDESRQENEQQQQQQQQLSSEPVFVGRLTVKDGVVLPAGGQKVTKQSVRQVLAFVSSCYPQARPTRGMLKQVFNFFNPAPP